MSGPDWTTCARCGETVMDGRPCRCEREGPPRGTLAPNEPHPAYPAALRYLRSIPRADMAVIMEAMASCAIEGDRLGEVCAETWRRLQAGETVSDRYLMGLAWAVWGAKEGRE